MNVQELLDKELTDNTRDSVKYFASVLKDLGLNNEQIYQRLENKFSKIISPDELKQLIKETKE